MSEKNSKVFPKPIFKKPYLLFVGSRYGYKNFAKLLSVYCLNKDLNKNYNLVAFGGGSFSKKEKRYITEMGLSSENILQITGDDDLLKEFYRNASLFIYPSLYEGFGLPLLEAMSCGCPVACSHTSSMPEIAGNAASFFDPNSSVSINKVINLILTDENKKIDLINKGYERIKKFGWEKCVKLTLEEYKNLL